MHGPTRRAGSVASVRRIKNVSRLAKTVMERTNHVMIVGDGARRFGVAEGFEEMNLLTEHSRKIWLAWKPKRVLTGGPARTARNGKSMLRRCSITMREKIAYAMRVHHMPANWHDQLAWR